MKNRLTDLNDALFAQLERLTDESLTAEQITQELQRTTSVVQLADRIVDTARLQLDGARFIAEHNGPKQLPASLALPSGAPKP
jgi:hypothetical protein